MRRGLALITAVLTSSMALPARADRLGDDLTSLWESVWDQRGEPQRLTRWDQPLRFRAGGPQGARHRAAIAAAVGKAAEAAQLAASEVALPPPGSTVLSYFPWRRDKLAYDLGLAHKNATGVAADALEAHRWLATAARAGHAPAQRELEQLEKAMDGAPLGKARAQGPR